ncbi:gamma-glutamyl-gamma-aminobutyrate hydrolase family protein [Aquabacterium sp. A7-Y]|uniref:gamma-glutamyl-gamma-aminobutyrate hydrolase family protein n=1 Tax=Aquabacterium sp. A7-Y TaxID=1349605 RepID=UPI00223DC993|nr:gamma-glutamyl-gamma-aminobutyrate hydrolase family protein [Aquabacterium sp. A7-Y]MCW7536843.1 gamma-glutamyl-gamma-aminobutyrate hydrolase family protein [Aquabacterium sp. A7-Y]
MTFTLAPSQRPLPVVLVPACNKWLGHHAFHVAGKKYVDAVRLAGCLPLVVPSGEAAELEQLLALADGVLLTGSVSNVHPSHFGEEVHDSRLPLDPGRDAWTLALIPAALERGLPLFAICRGLQEANVALGGSLHQALQEQPDKHDHRSRDEDPVEVQYGFAHPVKVEAGGVLDALLGQKEFEVNSLHGQGIKRLAEGLRVEATAPDGLIEAFSNPRAPGFNLFVQWHPEWQAQDNPVSLKLFKAFGAACHAWRDRHRDPKT